MTSTTGEHDGVAAMMLSDNASRMLGIEVVEYGPSWARARMLVRDDMVNGHGTAHGGLIFSLADTAFACACNGTAQTVAADCDIVFVAPARLGDTLEAFAEHRVSFGRNSVYDVTVRRGDQVIAEFRGRGHQLRDKTPRESSR